MERPPHRRRQKQVPLLLASGAIIALATTVQLLWPSLLPHGPAVDVPPHRHPPVSAAVDPSNVSLRLASGKFTKIYERLEDGREPLLVGPETIVFDGRGVMFVMNERAQLVSLTDFEPQRLEPHEEGGDAVLTARATEVADLGVGRPLGGRFDRSGTCLYFADAVLGLARICDLPAPSTPAVPRPRVELLASRVRLADGSWSPIAYADDVDVGPRTGHVYFSDASDVGCDKDAAGRWDVMYASKLEGVRGKRTGRLLRYRPETGEVDVLATGAAFANGVAVDKDETFVLYTSTFDGAVMKYHLTGERTGPERMLQLAWALDGADCSLQRGVCYVALPAPFPPLFTALFSLPTWARSAMMMLPRTWGPKPAHYGAVAEIDPGDGTAPARILRTWQDPDSRDTQLITGVTEFEGKLYLGSLHNDHVGVLTLD